MSETTNTLLELREVSKRFGNRADLAARIAQKLRLAQPPLTVHAVDRVSLQVRRGEVVGLVGESGCGKSTLGRMAAGILPPSEGEIFRNGRNTATMARNERHRAELAVQMVFQNPMAALNPRMRVEEIIIEAPRAHGMITGKPAQYADHYLRLVGFDPGMKHRYPHQFSGGQRQRINIARALAVQPAFCVCDESVAALDVSIQAQIINLFMELRERLDLTYLFISHDLSVVEHISDRVVIMYLGRIIETGLTGEVFARPNHPYTKALLAEIPRIDPKNRTFHPIRGQLPSPLSPPDGCHFHPRCPEAMAQCRHHAPPQKEVAPGHWSACWLNEASTGC